MSPSPAVTADLAHDLRLATMRLARRLRQQRADHGIPLGQISVLATLDRLGPLTPGALAQHEQVRPPTMTKVLANLKSDEANVKAVLAKVQLGEGDAGIVYKTDAAAAGNEVKAIAIPDMYNIIAEYPIGAMADSSNVAAARAFVTFVLSDAGQAILAKYGFGKP